MDHQRIPYDSPESEWPNFGYYHQWPIRTNPIFYGLTSSLQQVKSLFLCDISKLNLKPTQESCLIALACKQFLDAVHLCQFSINQPNKLLYQIQPNTSSVQPNICIL